MLWLAIGMGPIGSVPIERVVEVRIIAMMALRRHVLSAFRFADYERSSRGEL